MNKEWVKGILRGRKMVRLNDDIKTDFEKDRRAEAIKNLEFLMEFTPPTIEDALK